MKNNKSSSFRDTTLASAALVMAAEAVTIRVPQDQSSIKAAVAAANDGDIILINDGIYKEHDIIISKALTITSVSGRSATIIDAQNLGGCFRIETSDTSKAVISGLTIQNADARQGGLTAIRRFSGCLEVRDCLFEHNYANGGVIDGRAGADQEIYQPEKTSVLDCTFLYNEAENFAGVISVTAVRCLFYANTAWNNPAVLTECQATNCTAYGNTGGVLSNPWTTGGASGGVLVNCILWDNSGYNGQQVNRVHPLMTISYCIVQGGAAGIGVLDADPMFLDPIAGDFHLQPGSPGIDAGEPTLFDSDGTRSDIGCYGGETSQCSPHAARATAILYNGFLVGAEITDPGCGYTNPPVVLIQNGGGTGAVASATILDGRVTAITIINAGSGYTSIPRIVVASPPFVPTVSIAVSRVKVAQHVTLGRTYVLESSGDLKSWHATGPEFTAESETIVNEFEVVKNGQFFRIREVN